MPATPETPARTDAEQFPPWNGGGRRFLIEDIVGLGDADARGNLRLDGIARLLQGVSVRDSDDSGFLDPWVLRRLALHLDGTPTFAEYLELATWCSGTGAAVAERRTTISVTAGRGRRGAGTGARIEAAAIWVHLDPATGAPAVLPPHFDATYGAGTASRRVRGRLTLPGPERATGPIREEPWRLRTTDVDLVGHVHNAAYWAPVESARRSAWGNRPVTDAVLEFRGGIDLDEPLTVTWTSPDSATLAVWLSVDDDVRAAARLVAAD